MWSCSLRTVCNIYLESIHINVWIFGSQYLYFLNRICVCSKRWDDFRDLLIWDYNRLNIKRIIWYQTVNMLQNRNIELQVNLKFCNPSLGSIRLVRIQANRNHLYFFHSCIFIKENQKYIQWTLYAKMLQSIKHQLNTIILTFNSYFRKKMIECMAPLLQNAWS